jgi:hypothetical protein
LPAKLTATAIKHTATANPIVRLLIFLLIEKQILRLSEAE